MDEIKRLADKYPEPTPSKFERYMPRMERLVHFYDEKKDIAPERQGNLFKGFIHALNYFITTAKMYRKLTRELKNKAEEADNENTSKDTDRAE